MTNDEQIQASPQYLMGRMVAIEQALRAQLYDTQSRRAPRSSLNMFDQNAPALGFSEHVARMHDYEDQLLRAGKSTGLVDLSRKIAVGIRDLSIFDKRFTTQERAMFHLGFARQLGELS